MAISQPSPSTYRTQTESHVHHHSERRGEARPKLSSDGSEGTVEQAAPGQLPSTQVHIPALCEVIVVEYEVRSVTVWLTPLSYRVAENSKLNSMDSKNLAICWWPTLLPIEFSDMGRFEQMRPYLEDIVQTMIDQYPFLFCGKEAYMMV